MFVASYARLPSITVRDTTSVPLHCGSGPLLQCAVPPRYRSGPLLQCAVPPRYRSGPLLQCAVPPRYCSGPPLQCAVPPRYRSGPLLQCAVPPRYRSGPPLQCAVPPRHRSGPLLQCAVPPRYRFGTCRETALLYRATPSITRAQRTSSEVSENQSFSNKHSLRSVAQRSCSLFSVKAPVSGGQCKQTSKHSTQGVFTAVFTSLYISSL